MNTSSPFLRLLVFIVIMAVCGIFVEFGLIRPVLKYETKFNTTVETNCIRDGGRMEQLTTRDKGCYKNGTWIPIRF